MILVTVIEKRAMASGDRIGITTEKIRQNVKNDIATAFLNPMSKNHYYKKFRAIVTYVEFVFVASILNSLVVILQ